MPVIKPPQEILYFQLLKHMETKIYSSSGFSHHCSTEELYVLALHWFSDIRFFEYEITFFSSLIHRFFLPRTNTQQEHRILEIEEKLKELTNRQRALKEDLLNYQNQLSAILDQGHNGKEEYLNAVQSKLEGDFFDFIKTYRCIKQDLIDVNNILFREELIPKALEA